MEAIRKLFAQINEFWSGKSKIFQRNVIIGAVAAVAAIAILSAVLTRVDYAPLYTNLSSEDSGQLLSTLESIGVSARVSGSTVEVPTAQRDRLRMQLADQGFPKNSKNLDIVAQGQGIMLTDKDKQVYVTAQLEQNIRNALKTMSGVKDAYVNLTMPENTGIVLSGNKTDARASVVLTLGGGELTANQIKAVYLLVQNSVANLSPENISIVDSNMNVLEYSSGDDSTAGISDRLAFQKSVQQGMQKQIQALLEPLLGAGKVTSQVHVVLDWEDRVTDTEQFSPPVGYNEGLVRSMERTKETIKNGTGAVATGTTTNTGTTTYPAITSDGGNYSKDDQRINYELNSLKERIIKEKGAVKELSVSVIINSTDLKTDLSDDVKDLVVMAVGAQPDNVTVKSLPMAGSSSVQAMVNTANEQAAAALKAQQMRYYIAIGAIALLILVAMMLIFRNRAMARKAEMAAAEALAAAAQREADEQRTDLETASAISLVGDSGTKVQIGKFIETNPELVTNLLRSWLADDQE